MARDFLKGRSAAYGTNAMIATSHPDASLTGIEVLRRGGNAIDAAIAASAMLCVVEPAMTGIGGDCFAIVARPGEEPIAINGSGYSAAGASLEAAGRRSLTAIADNDPLAVTIPGAVDAWCRLHERFGKLGLDALMESAANRAQDGYAVAPRVAHDWAQHAGRLARNAAISARFLPGGKPPRCGDTHRQPELADTLREIGRKGRAGFYDGAVADDIVATLAALGGPQNQDDLAAQAADFVTPLSGRFAGYDLLECPPNGQGATALLILAALGDWTPWKDAKDPKLRAHLYIQATKQAYHLRNLGITDPEAMRISIGEFLSEGSIKAVRDYCQAPAPQALAQIAPWETDTICLSVVDKDGLAVSFINSLFSPFGSTILAPESGVMLQCRGTSFNLDSMHVNCLAPRKRPMHTIIPGMLMQNKKVVMPFGVMGGQYQAAGHAALLMGLLEEGLDLQAAIDAPRMFGYGDLVQVEADVPPEIVSYLTEAGHKVETAATPLGGAQAVWIDHQRGVLIGGSDQRKDGLALGY